MVDLAVSKNKTTKQPTEQTSKNKSKQRKTKHGIAQSLKSQGKGQDLRWDHRCLKPEPRLLTTECILRSPAEPHLAELHTGERAPLLGQGAIRESPLPGERDRAASDPAPISQDAGTTACS